MAVTKIQTPEHTVLTSANVIIENLEEEISSCDARQLYEDFMLRNLNISCGVSYTSDQARSTSTMALCQANFKQACIDIVNNAISAQEHQVA